MIASQLKTPLNEIPPHKIADLLAIKKTLGLPDARFAKEEDVEEPIAELVGAVLNGAAMTKRPSQREIDSLVESLSSTIADFLERHGAE